MQELPTFTPAIAGMSQSGAEDADALEAGAAPAVPIACVPSAGDMPTPPNGFHWRFTAPVQMTKLHRAVRWYPKSESSSKGKEATARVYGDIIQMSDSERSFWCLLCDKSLSARDIGDFGNAGKHIATVHSEELAYSDVGRWQTTSSKKKRDDDGSALASSAGAAAPSAGSSVPFGQTTLVGVNQGVAALQLRIKPAFVNAIIGRGMPFSACEDPNLRAFLLAGAGLPPSAYDSIKWPARRQVTSAVVEQLSMEEASDREKVMSFIRSHAHGAAGTMTISVDGWMWQLRSFLGIILTYVDKDWRLVDVVVACSVSHGEHDAGGLQSGIGMLLQIFFGADFAKYLLTMLIDAGHPLALDAPWCENLTAVTCINHRGSTALGKLFDPGATATQAADLIQELALSAFKLAAYFRKSPRRNDALHDAQRARNQDRIASAASNGRPPPVIRRTVSYLKECNTRWFYEADSVGRHLRLLPSLEYLDFGKLMKGSVSEQASARDELKQLIADAKANEKELTVVWALMMHLHAWNKWFQQQSTPTLGSVLSYIRDVHHACDELLKVYHHSEDDDDEQGTAPSEKLSLILHQFKLDWSGGVSSVKPNHAKILGFMDSRKSSHNGVFAGFGANPFYRFAEVSDPRSYAEPLPPHLDYAYVSDSMLWALDVLLPLLTPKVWRAKIFA